MIKLISLILVPLLKIGIKKPLEDERVIQMMAGIGIKFNVNDFNHIYICSAIEFANEHSIKEIEKFFCDISVIALFQQFFSKSISEEELNKEIDEYLKALKSGEKLKDCDISVHEIIPNFIQIYYTNAQKKLSPSDHILLKSNSEIMDKIDNFENYVRKTLSDIHPTAGDKASHENEIDIARDLLESHKPFEAKQILLKLQETKWDDLTKHERFRLLTNLGCAEVSLGNNIEASNLFVNANEYNSESETARSNLVLSKYLKNPSSVSDKDINEVLAIYPSNMSMIVLRIKLSQDSIEDIEKKIPSDLKQNIKVIIALGQICQNRNEFIQAESYYRQAMKLKADDPELMASLGTVIMQNLLEKDKLITSSIKLNQHQEVILEEALEYLETAWNLSDIELQKPRSAWIQNLALGERLLRRYDTAYKYACELSRLEPDNLAAKRNTVLLLSELGKEDDAIELLTTSDKYDCLEDKELMLCELYFFKERYTDIINTINSLEENGSQILKIPQIYHFKIESLHKINEDQKIVELLEKINSLEIDNIEKHMLIAHGFKSLGDKQNSFNSIKNILNEPLTSFQRKYIADLLFDLRKFNEALPLYEKLNESQILNNTTQKYAFSLFYCGNTKKTIQLCSHLKDEYPELIFPSEILFNIYEETGHYDLALLICDDFLKLNPTSIKFKLYKAQVWIAQGDHESINEMLNEPFQINELSLIDCTNIAYLFQICKRYEDGINFLYYTRLAFKDDSTIHLKYMTFFHQNSLEVKAGFLNNVVNEYSVFKIKNSNGNEETFRIEPDDYADITNNIITSKHKIALNTMGKKVGDKFIISENQFDSPETGEITFIIDKRISALNEIHEKYKIWFPEQNDMSTIKIDVNNPESIKETLSNVLDKKKDFATIYTETVTPIGTYASALNKSPIEIFGILLSNTNISVRVTDETIQEMIKANGLLSEQKQAVIFDITILLILNNLQVLNKITRKNHNFIILQSTLDLINEHITELNSNTRDESITVGKIDDELVTDIRTREDIDKAIEFYSNIKKWITTECTISPCESALKLNREDYINACKGLTSSYADIMYLAEEKNAIVVSDDLIFRKVLKSKKINTAWSQVFLHNLYSMNHISTELYNEAIVQLCLYSYENTSINSEIILTAIRLDDWKQSTYFNAVLKYLSTPLCDKERAIDVAVDFFKMYWMESTYSINRNNIVVNVLESVSKGYSRREVADLIKDRINNSLIIVSSNLDDLIQIIDTWVAARPLF